MNAKLVEQDSVRGVILLENVESDICVSEALDEVKITAHNVFNLYAKRQAEIPEVFGLAFDDPSVFRWGLQGDLTLPISPHWIRCSAVDDSEDDEWSVLLERILNVDTFYALLAESPFVKSQPSRRANFCTWLERLIEEGTKTARLTFRIEDNVRYDRNGNEYRMSENLKFE